MVEVMAEMVAMAAIKTIPVMVKPVAAAVAAAMVAMGVAEARMHTKGKAAVAAAMVVMAGTYHHLIVVRAAVAAMVRMAQVAEVRATVEGWLQVPPVLDTLVVQDWVLVALA